MSCVKCQSLPRISAKGGDIIMIERAEEVEFCSANGADLAQGYYFGKPNPEPIRKLN
jgi:c-di-GMP-related signal transduction protein